MNETELIKIFADKINLLKNNSMSGNGNNSIYPILSTWISTWTEPEAL